MVHKQKLNLGLNIKRLREMVGMKQEVIAAGCDWRQQKMPKLEHSKDIDEVDLITVARVLGFTVEVVKNFNEAAAVSIIRSNFTFQQIITNHMNYQPTVKNQTASAQVPDSIEKLIKNDQERTQILVALSTTVLELATSSYPLEG